MGLFWKSKKEKEQELKLEQEKNSYIPEVDCSKQNFTMAVADTFVLMGRGLVVVGLITSGMCKVGDKVEIVRRTGERIETTITGIEVHRRQCECAYSSEHVAVALRGITKEQVSKDDMLFIQR